MKKFLIFIFIIFCTSVIYSIPWNEVYKLDRYYLNDGTTTIDYDFSDSSVYDNFYLESGWPQKSDIDTSAQVFNFEWWDAEGDPADPGDPEEINIWHENVTLHATAATFNVRYIKPDYEIACNDLIYTYVQSEHDAPDDIVFLGMLNAEPGLVVVMLDEVYGLLEVHPIATPWGSLASTFEFQLDVTPTGIVTGSYNIDGSWDLFSATGTLAYYTSTDPEWEYECGTAVNFNPEPSTLVLLFIGIIGMGYWKKKKR